MRAIFIALRMEVEAGIGNVQLVTSFPVFTSLTHNVDGSLVISEPF